MFTTGKVLVPYFIADNKQVYICDVTVMQPINQSINQMFILCHLFTQPAAYMRQ